MQPNQIPFAFFGTPWVARATLSALLDSGYVPQVVVTSPDAAKGRGLEVLPCEAKALAVERGLPVLMPHRLDESFADELARYGCRYAIVAAYGKILPQRVLDLFPMGVLNVHYSLLPKYRGASPVEQALLHGDTETGVTIQRMVLKMDAGDIVTQKSVTIDSKETIRELRSRLVQLGSELLIDMLPDYLAGTAPVTPQDESGVTIAPKISKEEGRISLHGNPEENWKKFRAYCESPGTYFYAKKGDKRIRVKITDAIFVDGVFMIKTIVPESKTAQDYSMLMRNGWEAE
jgi:methionyl-tRNA formyltransferase